MVECEGECPSLVASPRLDILIAHDLIHNIESQQFLHVTPQHVPIQLPSACMAGSRLKLTRVQK